MLVWLGMCVECRWRKGCITEGKKRGGRDRRREGEGKNKGREEKKYLLLGLSPVTLVLGPGSTRLRVPLRGPGLMGRWLQRAAGAQGGDSRPGLARQE